MKMCISAYNIERFSDLLAYSNIHTKNLKLQTTYHDQERIHVRIQIHGAKLYNKVESNLGHFE